MHYKVLKNVITKDNIQSILKLYNNSTNRTTTVGMDKLQSPWSYSEINCLEEILSEHIDTKENIGDNVYKHYFPYYPHVDIDERYPSINCLIPLYIDGGHYQSFVIFDQYVTNTEPKTWVGNRKDLDFQKNKAASFVYLDDAVMNKTGKDIDDVFYKTYLENTNRNKDLFYSMSGTAVEYNPGDIILFDSKHIHCTGRMKTKYKIGCSLRFRGSL